MNKKQWTKHMAYRELMQLTDELKEKTCNFKTGSFPDYDLNTEILAFNDEIIANNYIEEKEDGTTKMVSDWYKKHTVKQIQDKVNYFHHKLDSLLDSKSYKATMELDKFLNGAETNKLYITVELIDTDDKNTFVASMSKVRFNSFKEELREGERPYVALRTILADYDCRNQARSEADCEY